MDIIKRLIGKSELYKFLAWNYNNYLNSQMREYKPEQFKEYGKDIKIDSNVIINMPIRMVIKDKVSINAGTMINSQGGLYIGANSGIGYDCTIFTVQHNYREARSIPYDNIVELKPVIIREFVWIGAGVKILPGIEIGEGAIIGMGAVVTKKVPPLAIILGNPAEIIGYRSKEHYYNCKKNNEFQDISVQKYEEILPYMIKIKYERELKELGMI